MKSMLVPSADAPSSADGCFRASASSPPLMPGCVTPSRAAEKQAEANAALEKLNAMQGSSTAPRSPLRG